MLTSYFTCMFSIPLYLFFFLNNTSARDVFLPFVLTVLYAICSTYIARNIQTLPSDLQAIIFGICNSCFCFVANHYAKTVFKWLKQCYKEMINRYFIGHNVVPSSDENERDPVIQIFKDKISA